MTNFKKILTVSVVLFLLLFSSFHAMAQTGSVRGVVLEAGTTNPVPFATVQILPHNIFTLTNIRGEFEFPRLDAARMHMTVQMMGKENIDTTLILGAGQNLNVTFSMLTTSFHLETVTVTAVENRAGASTSSTISRAALDHLQINSLAGIMQLLPGGGVFNPNLIDGNYFSIRGNVSSSGLPDNMNSLGTAIIMDGAPISTNANLQTVGATRQGNLDDPTALSTNVIRGAGSGVDLRQISTDNIESIEVIRGIPSAEHGDLTAGAVLIRTRAGQEPLRIIAKTNPNIYELSVSKGIHLGGNRGSLNTAFNYAYSVRSLTESHLFFQRVNAQVTYSNTFFRNLNSTTIFSYTLGRDTRNPNPDDLTVHRRSGATNNNFRLNTRGRWNFDIPWLTHINYTLSGDIANQHSFLTQLATSAQMTRFNTSWGHGLSLTSASETVRDEEGNIIATPAAERNEIVTMLPALYTQSYTIDGRPVNVFANLSANLMRQITPELNCRFIIGMDFRSHGNLGAGLSFHPDSVPFRAAGAALGDATLRTRPFRDIPFVNQLGIFAETNILWTVFNRDFHLRAGVRHDRVGDISATVPRVNASFEVLPRILSIRGGYGISAKAPTMIHLHPEMAFFDFVNYNQMFTSLPQEQQFTILTTHAFEVDNSDLQMATTRKAEVGLDLRLGQVSLHATYFDEVIRNGFRMGTDLSTHHLVPHTMFHATAPETPYVLRRGLTKNRFAIHSRPLNDATVLSRGFEFEMNTGRIRDIRTTFVLTGAYRRFSSWSDGYSFSIANDMSLAAPPAGYAREQNIAVWDPRSSVAERELLSTNLRVIHNIPRLGFVVSLSTQVVWLDRTWTTFGQDTIPLMVMSHRDDGTPREFTREMYHDARAAIAAGQHTEFSELIRLRSPNRLLSIPASYRPYLLMNVHLTKEISNFLTISFFANNMFGTHPLRESTRVPGSFSRLNQHTPLFFGVELRANIR